MNEYLLTRLGLEKDPSNPNQLTDDDLARVTIAETCLRYGVRKDRSSPYETQRDREAISEAKQAEREDTR